MAREDPHISDRKDAFEERPLKDGERLVAPTRRPDGTMRKAIRIRAGYTPQDEVAVYQSKGALYRRGLPQVPPGYDPVEDAPQRPMTKSAKKNQKRKEKKNRAEESSSVASNISEHFQPSIQETSLESDGVKNLEIDAVVQQMAALGVLNKDLADEAPGSVGDDAQYLEKRMRALKKKIRDIESLQSSSTNKGDLNLEQSEKLSRLEAVRMELQNLEAQKASL